MEKMVKPLLDIHGIYEPSCKYPTKLLVAMDDGRVLPYILENRVSLQFEELKNCMDKMVGYKYRPKRKNRTHR